MFDELKYREKVMSTPSLAKYYEKIAFRLDLYTFKHHHKFNEIQKESFNKFCKYYFSTFYPPLLKNKFFYFYNATLFINKPKLIFFIAAIPRRW